MNPTAHQSLPFPPSRGRLLQRGALAGGLLLSLVLTGCGGGTSDGPTVTLAVTPTSAAAGATVTLIAVASSDVGMSAVRFYRVDASANTLLGTLNASPYQFTTTIPTTASGSVSYVARAVDADANTTDSDTATVTVTN